ncbi:MAG: terpene cyclase/mutase family protein [Verrucomicrobiae bacterium]|nr:terpene cyclase/mutase family protein [Verrucomicrobiae bacterium]
MKEVLQRLHAYCAAQQWRGFDPYDGLLSPWARWLPGKFARQAWTQLHRRSPVNLRRLCGIRPTWNAKGLALFIMGGANGELREWLLGLRARGGGWGYPFPWQSRAFYAPAGTPNLICTYFAVKALAGGHLGEPTARERLDEKAVQFVERELVVERGSERWITYIPGSTTQVHNINMLGAALLGRPDCMEWSVKRQRPDGSWWYGEASNQRWVDNFHTAYSLLALREQGGFEKAMERGFDYWQRTFWKPNGEPLYHHDGSGPTDVHCSAVGVLTFLAFGERGRARKVAEWAVDNMWDERGFFWYQRKGRRVNRICYMRWTQAWMYYALSRLVKSDEEARA